MSKQTRSQIIADINRLVDSWPLEEEDFQEQIFYTHKDEIKGSLHTISRLLISCWEFIYEDTERNHYLFETHIVDDKFDPDSHEISGFRLLEVADYFNTIANMIKNRFDKNYYWDFEKDSFFQVKPYTKKDLIKLRDNLLEKDENSLKDDINVYIDELGVNEVLRRIEKNGKK